MGEILIDDKEVNESVPLWQRCALVEAQDDHYRDLSVKDLVTFAMKLRCPNRAALQLVSDNVANTLEILHLTE